MSGGSRRPRTPCAPVALSWADLSEALALVSYTLVSYTQEERAFVCLSLAHEVLAQQSSSARSVFLSEAASWLPSPGTAVRHCDEHRGWLPPNLFNCTSVTFSELKGFVSETPHLRHLPPLPSIQSYVAHPALRNGFWNSNPCLLGP